MRLVAILAVILAVVAHGGKHADHADQKSDHKQTESSLAAPKTKAGQEPTSSKHAQANEQDEPQCRPAPATEVEQSPQRWRRREWASFIANLALAVFGLIGIIVGVGSMFAVISQGNHIVNSERAWMVAHLRPDEQNPMMLPVSVKAPVGVTCILENKGKTPAFILEAAQAIEVVKGGSKLPDIPPPYAAENIARWEGRGIPVSPDVGFPRFVSKDSDAAVRILDGHDVLWIYGYVKYRDVFSADGPWWFFRGKVRETRYCYRWMPPKPEIGFGPQFVQDGPAVYNHTT